jgi:hypothetical protein
MSLSLSQLATLKQAIESDPALSAAPLNSDGAFFIAAELNKTAAPDFIVWRTSVTQDEIMQNGFDWTRVDNLSVGLARVWEWMFANADRAINPAKPNVRAGIEAVWKGTAADLAVRSAVYVHCKRKGTRAEKLFAIGAGSDAAPAVMTFEGDLNYLDVERARQVE